MQANAQKRYSTASQETSRYSWLLLLFAPIIVNGLWESRGSIPYSNFLEIDFSKIEFAISNSNIFKVIGFTGLFSAVFSLTVITLFEITSIKGSISKKISYSSVGRVKKSKGYKYADIWYFLLETFFKHKIPYFTLLLTLGFSSSDRDILAWFQGVYQSFFPQVSNEFLSTILFIIAVMLNDFVGYLSHRLVHSVPFMWDLHEFHHSASEMTILSNYRGVPLEKLFTITLFLPIKALPTLLVAEYLSKGYFIPFIIYTIYLTASQFSVLLGHSSLKVIFPKPISYIFMSPSLHWLHHSSNPKHYDCNFGAIFTFWDKLFSTYLDETNLDDISEFGVINTEYNKHHPAFSYAVLPVLLVMRRIKSCFI